MLAGSAAGGGTLRVDNGTLLSAVNVFTELPPQLPAPSDSTALAPLVIEGQSRLGLTSDATVGDLFLRDTATLWLHGYTLYVNSNYHADWGSDDFVEYDGGTILWLDRGPGTLIMVK